MKALTQRSRFWVVTVAALLAAGLTFSMGQWQLRRAAQKQALQASLEQKNSLPALGNADLAKLASVATVVPSDAVSLAALTDRRVSITGLWQPAHTVYLDNRPMNGRPGFWVLTPLQLDGVDKAVLVQRGWIPRDFAERSRLAPVQTPSVPVSLQGRMAPGPAKLYAFEGVDSGLIRQNLDMGAYIQETQLPLVAGLVLQTGPASEGLQREWAAPNKGVDKHHGYAAQWFGLSALVLGLYVWFQWILPRRQRP
jgi:surfeit locus 1 family protein